MKLGCAIGCFSRPYFEPPYEEGIKTIGELGFNGIELIAFTKKDLDEYYTPSRIKSLRKLYQSYDLTLSQFALFANLVGGLASLDPKKKQEALDFFERGTRLGKELGTGSINIVSDWPEGLQAPMPYPPNYIYPYVPRIDYFSPKLTMDLPEGFDWDKVWDNYVDSIKSCVEIVEKYGLRFTLEGHAHVIVGTTDAFLRMWEHIGSESLGANFDTAWQLIQREYLPMSIYKLKNKLFHMHVRDGDGMLCYVLPPGSGIIDWDALVEALQDIGYDGYLSFELARYKNPTKYVKQAKEYLEQVLRRHQ